MKFKKIIRRILKVTGILFGMVLLMLFGLFIYLNSLLVSKPDFSSTYHSKVNSFKQLNDSTRTVGKNYLTKIREGFYQMYVEGAPFERGNAIGILTSDLHEFQEDAFVNQIRKMVPSEFYLKFLKYFVAFFNRNIEDHIPLEYCLEIYGESIHMSSKYDNIIGSPYMRILNYHAAHDIGHALQDKNFVAGCTSFAAWGPYTNDGNLLIGRNFDFYVGDEFAKNKIVAFFRPDEGIPFGMVTWPGMIGVVSGMNLEQLTVTINAAKSAYPTEAKTPISILARQILQYAHNLDEAVAIAKKFDLFVSESILISSGKENRAIIIEKSPEQMDVFYSNDSIIYCSNHFQSETFKSDSINNKFRSESSSGYRFERLKELIGEQKKLDPEHAALILRDPYGLKGVPIGWGNEDAINQLIAHHSVIFKPEKNEMWVSTSPYQLGKYVRFNLKEIFIESTSGRSEIHDISAADNLINIANVPYQKYKKLISFIQSNSGNRSVNSGIKDSINKMIYLNKDYYYSYEIAGDYFSSIDNKTQSIRYYKKALQHNIPLAKYRISIEQKLRKNF